MNVVEGDSGIEIRLSLMEGEEPIDLSSATVTAVFSNGKTRTEKTAQIIDPSGGKALTRLEAAETGEDGILEMQIRINMIDGSRFSSEIENITVTEAL